VHITFDEFSIGTTVTDQYRSVGVDFVSDGQGHAPFIAADRDNPTSPALSGSPKFQGDITGTFVNADGTARTVDNFSIDVGYIDAIGTTTVTAYDAEGKKTESVVIDTYGMNTVPISDDGIASFTVADPDEPNGFAIDNLTFSGQPPSDAQYVALGDSYSSGEGDPPFDDGTDERTNRCHRSSQAWPRMVGAADSTLQPMVQLACSGAETPDITVDWHENEPPQLVALQALGASPRLITITIGGNDVGFADMIKNCVFHDCKKNGELETRTEFITDELPQLLTSTLLAIKAKAPEARLVLVGYPSLVPADYGLKRGCIWLRRNEDEGLVALAAALNRSQQAAADAAEAGYVPVLPALRGHELCTADPWVQPVSFWAVIHSYTGHPTVEGQREIGTLVTAYLTGTP
jgi:lysophospholipase L1-like esterase